MTTSYCLFPVNTSDAEVITRSVDVPAMRNGPLFRTMFPTDGTMSSTAREVMTQWYIDGMEEALKDQSDHMCLKRASALVMALMTANYGQLASADLRSSNARVATTRRSTTSSQRKKRHTIPRVPLPGSRDGENCLRHSTLTAGLPFQRNSGQSAGESWRGWTIYVVSLLWPCIRMFKGKESGP